MKMMQGADFSLLADYYRLLRVYMGLLNRLPLDAEETVYLVWLEGEVLTRGAEVVNSLTKYSELTETIGASEGRRA